MRAIFPGFVSYFHLERSLPAPLKMACRQAMHVTQTPGPAMMSLGLAEDPIEDEKQACPLRKMLILAHLVAT